MDSRTENEVIVVDVKMRFGSMVVFMVKWVVASIPAFIILALLWAIALALFQGLVGHGPLWHWRMR